ncbi:hypothetical protein OGH69_03555 [Flavobacterium sp. MFBS3-15]|uniref:hypothetical protein n=1 Tax=Flavobacterium sp. MFBS3-15 TaxID=2989816 RepID=UPI0022359645|nr:hypothetical protein [Flavobacterium sp. MFBS3-15]MCW4468030.1 hypothetical protein [Flavobacterium sp. MFBS3-15]
MLLPVGNPFTLLSMVRNLTLKILFLFLPFAAFSQNRIKDTVYGNVKSVREKLYFLDSVRQSYKLYDFEDEYGHPGFRDREFTQKRFNTFWYHMPIVHYMNYYREYDDRNRIVAETWYYKDNAFLTKYEFTYDEKGNLIVENESNEFGEIITIRRGYDHKNRVATRLKSYKESDTYFFYGNQYNRAGELIATNAYRDNEKASDRKFEYESGRLVRVYYTLPYTLVEGDYPGRKKKIHGEWETYLYEEYEYDERGNKITVKNYSGQMAGDSTTPDVTRYIYDAHDNLITTINSNGLLPWTWAYDDKGRLTSEKLISNGDIAIETKYIYKGDNLIKLLYTENGKTTTVTFSYAFDSHNNWTEQTKSINGKPLYVRKREIVYD